jgi:protein SCO1/2
MREPAIVSTLVVIILVAGCMGTVEVDRYQGQDINPAVSYRPFMLQDDNGSIFNSSSISSSVVVFGFIYVNCPDVCPTTTADMKWVESQLNDAERANTSFISVTVDPWRDGPTALTYYKEDYNVSWPHLTTNTHSEENLSLIEQVWTDFNIGLILTEANSSSSLGRGHTVYYDIEHTNGLVLVDSDGFQRVRWTHDDWDQEGILSDVRSLLN